MTSAVFGEGFDAPEYYVDGFDGYEIKDGILSCYGFRDFKGIRQIVVRLVMPVAGVPETIGRATAAMERMPMLAIVERGNKPRH